MTNLGPGGVKSFARKFTPMNWNLNSWQSGIRFHTHIGTALFASLVCNYGPVPRSHSFLINGAIMTLSKLSCRGDRSQLQGSAHHLEADVHGAPWRCRCPSAQPWVHPWSCFGMHMCPSTTSSVPKCWCLLSKCTTASLVKCKIRL